MGHFGREAAAALVFAILYFCMFVYMTIMYATKRYKWRSRFTILYIHCLIRVASQVSRLKCLLVQAFEHYGIGAAMKLCT